MESLSTTETAISKNIPQLRFHEFDAFYQKYLFSEIFSFSTGKNIKQAQASPDFEIPCVRYGELYHMYDEVIEKVNNKTNLERKDLTFSKGDEILIPSAGEDPLDIGSASALTLSNIAIGRTINILKPKKKDYYSHRYVSFYINQKLKKEIARLAKGVSISNVYNSDLKKLKINLPSLPEQQKIANFLTQVDRKIELLDKQQAALVRYKKGVMQKIFNQEIRFKIKNEAGKLVEPSEWEEKKLGEIFFSKKGKGISKSQLDDNGQYKCILYGELYTTYNEAISSIKSKTDFDDGILSKENDLLIPSSTTTTGIDLANVTALDIPNIRLGGDIIILRSKEKINNVFYAYYLSNYKRLDIARRAQGITIVHLYFSSIESIKIGLPSLEEQTKIANFLSAIDTKIEAIAERSRSHREWKKGLLQKIFV